MFMRYGASYGEATISTQSAARFSHVLDMREGHMDGDDSAIKDDVLKLAGEGS